MAEREGGGRKVFRGVLIAVVTVAILVVIVAFWGSVVDAVTGALNFVGDRWPDNADQQVAIIAYLVLAVLIAVIFSKAGHFTAYGVAMGLVPLLWGLFWEGFPPLGLDPTWTDNLGVGHLGPGIVVTWAIVADIVITLVFVPLELWEKARRRGHRLGADDD